MSLVGSSSSLIVIQVVPLVSVSPEILTSYLESEGPCVSDQFQGFPETPELSKCWD